MFEWSFYYLESGVSIPAFSFSKYLQLVVSRKDQVPSAANSDIFSEEVTWYMIFADLERKWVFWFIWTIAALFSVALLSPVHCAGKLLGGSG